MLNFLILGAGPTGLGAAYHLNKLGHANWRIFERNAYVGGLAASFVDDQGFTWDIGGHVLFSHYPYFDQAVSGALGDAYYQHQRESWVRILQTWVPYPFQNNIRHLPDCALRECVAGLKTLRGTPATAGNFREWAEAVFGSGIVKYFMEPYNRKVWAMPLEQMSKDWIAERVSVVDLARIEQNIVEKRDDVNWGPNNIFLFPRTGGTGAIYEGIAGGFRDKITLNHEMQSIDLENKQVIFDNGRIVSYDFLINTSPLDLFIRSCIYAPDVLRAAIDDLAHNSGFVVGIGMRGKRDESKCWMYFPENTAPFYRVTNFHRYSPNNVPEGDVDHYFSLMCETSYSPHNPVCSSTIVEETIAGLVASDVISDAERNAVASRYLIDIPYSYPIPTLKRDKALCLLQSYLESQGVYSRGRFGGWKYEVANMDHSFMQGVEVVDRILNGQEELTYSGKIG
ncbi:MAG: FAD-dependent oxidoreductase [Desulfobulbus sp.]|jgi:protoporphyrinogen oxidase|uniref:protoporphyrinogen/coproporphyrinogen oxidase n=1 Tax=Desulfobulbus sp. TaxID=895 RepID=UPI0028419AF1|nr:FAD-dependent oxidoreductase [Desulfobulbus sp.]MDR2550390.1 FAD-dependent oxidoreductase [Desulfobulbus sp.]